MRIPAALLLAIVFALGASSAPAQTVIHFDELACPVGPVTPQCLIHDQYLPLGVLFDSAGGGIAVTSSNNPVSAPNVAVATTLSAGAPVWSYSDSVVASFWSGPAPAVVDFASITLSNSSSQSMLEAFDVAGASLGITAGGAAATLTVSFPGEIHSVVLHQGPMAFDDFTFGGLDLNFDTYCYGDGSQPVACPCGNTGLAGRGCDNSAATGGARLEASGRTSPDTVVLTAAGELPSVVSVFLQGQVSIGPVLFGDGLRCVAGALKRLYIKSASGGVVSAPVPGDPSITARSAALGDPIATGSSRYYQTYYRDPNLGFCPDPAGNSWNVSNAVQVDW